ncbi:MAG: hypothetical protein AAGF31_13100, partial [Planctomycetota bacterium]
IFAVANSSAQNKNESEPSEAETTDAAAPEAKRPPIAAKAARPKGRPTLTSGLNVPAGETFHLGERQTGAFIVSAYNRGREPVVILASRGKRRETVGVVKPEETVVRAFQTGDGVLVQNPSEKTKARLYVEVWGTRDLAMYYIPNEEEPPVTSDSTDTTDKPADGIPADTGSDK